MSEHENRESGAGNPEAVGALTDRLFRHESARLRAVLVRLLGPRRLDLADDIVQEALLAALQHWRFRGVPDNPAAWLTRVAQRKATDLVRRDRRHADAEPDLAAWAAARESTGSHAAEMRDDPLRLMFMCCHPRLVATDRVMLTLALVAGFGPAELARAFLVTPAAAEQRLVRAKRTLRESGASMDLPENDRLAPRLEAVLDTLYLMLNEGYTAHAGDQLTRHELIDESRRLLGMLLDGTFVAEESRPEVHALAALASFLASRLDARTDALGGLVLMEDQDRSRWDRGAIAEGFRHIALSTRGARVSAYGLEAAISATHAAAATFAETDWNQIVSLYTLLESAKPTPIVALNKAVAIGLRDGPDAGLAALDAIPVGGFSDRYHLLEAARGGVLLRAGRHADAARAFRLALERPCSDPERALLQAKLNIAQIRACRGTGL